MRVLNRQFFARIRGKVGVPIRAGNRKLSLLPPMTRFLFVSIFLVVGAVTTKAHPIPDIPVRGFFYDGGKARIEIEIDPRCFLEDPNGELYTLYWYLQRCDEEEKNAMLEEARAFIPTRVELVFDSPEGVEEPEFDITFTTHDGQPLEKLDDPVVMQATWETTLPAAARTYQIKAKKEGILSVLPLNHVNDEAIEKVQVLFPGEDSYVLDLPLAVTKEEIRSILRRPIYFGVGLFFAFLFLRVFRRYITRKT